MVREAVIHHAMKAAALDISTGPDQFATVILFCCLSFAGWVCIWFRRRRQQQEDDDFAAAVQLSLNEHLQTSSDVSSDRDAVSSRTVPDASMESSADQVVDIAEIKEQKGLLSTAAIFQMKRSWLNKELEQTTGRKGEKRVVKIAVRRDKVVKDSIAQFARVKPEARLLPLAVSFIGEAGRDDGGVTRDWYSALSRELVMPTHGLFTLTDSVFKAYDINSNCPAAPELFRFVGLVVGRGIRDKCLLDVPLSPLIYKRVLDMPLGLDDMASLDAEVHQNLCWLLEKDLGEGDLGLTFSFSQERGGEHVDVELKEGGSSLPVCEGNKAEFVDLLVEHRLRSSVAAQTLAFKEGVAEMVDPALLAHFDEKELELLVEGLPLIDPLEWRIHTVYGAGYFDDPNCLPVTWFWHIVEAWDQEMRARLLQFVTGSSKVPFPEGFMGLRGSDGPRRFHIVRVSDDTRLPQAHTCFNELILPDYESMEELSTKLVTAIFESGNQFQLR